MKTRARRLTHSASLLDSSLGKLDVATAGELVGSTSGECRLSICAAKSLPSTPPLIRTARSLLATRPSIYTSQSSPDTSPPNLRGQGSPAAPPLDLRGQGSPAMPPVDISKGRRGELVLPSEQERGFGDVHWGSRSSERF